MTSRLTFHPRAHRYKLDGEWVPGVTTIISQGFPKVLHYWSARTVAEFVADNGEEVEQLRKMGRGPLVAALKETPWQKRDDAADRGTVVHAIAEKVVAGEAAEVDDITGPYVQAAADFLDDFGVQPLIVERPHYHAEHLWAGTPDLLGVLPDGRLAIIDWKTGDSGIWPEVALQLGAYAHATHFQGADGEDYPAQRPDIGIAVWLQPGGYTAYEIPVTDHVYSRFRHVAVVAALAADFKNNKGAWVKEIQPALPLRVVSS